MDNALRMLGIAKKAGRLEVGEEPAGAAARAHEAKVLLVAADAADNTVRRAGHFAEQGNTPWIRVPFTKAELGQAVGRAACAMAALTEIGMAASLVSGLARQQPEVYGETAEALNIKAAKALKRLKEKRAHEKNLQRGGKKPWAAPPAQARHAGSSGAAGRSDGKRPPSRGPVKKKRSKPS